MGKFSEDLIFGATIRESATDGSDFTNPPADYRRLFLGEDGALHLRDSAGTVTDIGGSAGSVATDAIWDASGDLVQGTGANTAAKLTKGATGTVPTAGASSLAYAYPPGYELDYVETSANPSITHTTEATADVIVTSNAVTFDGTACWFEFYNPACSSPNGAFMLILLFDNTASTSASIGRLANITNATSQNRECFARRKLTPSAGSRTYSVRAIVASGSGAITNGAGGAATYMPGYLRITKA